MIPITQGYAQQMERLCDALGIVVTDEHRAFWQEIEQHNIDIRFRQITGSGF